MRRTKAGAYSLEDATPLEELLEAGVAHEQLLTGASAIKGMPHIKVDEASAAQLRHGQRPQVGPEVIPEDRVALAVLANTPVGLVRRHGDRLHVVRGFG